MQWRSGLSEWVGLPDLHRHLAEIVTTLDLPRESPILDLGCGTGAWLDRLRGLGFTNLLGIDIDASKFGAKAIECVEHDLEKGLPYLPGAPFRLVTAIEVIEHVANTGLLTRGIASVLAGDGFALLTTPNIHALAARLRFLLTSRLPHFDEKSERNHVSPIELSAFGRVLQQAGLEIVRVWSLPETGAGRVWRPAIRVLAGGGRMLLKDPLPGYELCLLLRRAAIPSCYGA